MRTFIALQFEDEPKNIIYDVLGEVRKISDSGNFTNKNNLHLTILYIGEISEKVLEAMNSKLMEIELQRFDYQTNRIRYFKKSNSRLIVYLGVDDSEELENLYCEVRNKLEEIELNIQSEKYIPHITLGRQIRVQDDQFLHNINCSKLSLKATSISIMESKKVRNKLIYEELYNIPLR